jgi:MFS family permease
MFKNPITRLVITVTVIANVLFFPFMPMVPVFAETVLFVNPVLMGLLGASFGLGNVIGSTYLGTFGKSTKPIKLFIFGTSIGFIFLLFFSISEIYWICWVMLFFAGLAMTGFGSMQSAITLMTVAPNIRGKALGVIGVAIGTAPLGLLFTGIISGRFGIEVAITLNCSIALCILTLSLFAYRKELFLEDAQIISQQNSN